MKRALIIASALALAALGYFWIAPAPRQETSAVVAVTAPPPEQPPEEKITLHTNEDATEVFRRAFWRDPTAEDHILHAERHEWAGKENGVRRWQWFIAVQPGPALVAWLRESNPFNLLKVDRVRSFEGFGPTPGWFPTPGDLAGCEIQQSAGKGMTIIFNAEKNLIYATDDGSGFAAVQALASASPATSDGAVMPPKEWQPRRRAPDTQLRIKPKR